MTIKNKKYISLKEAAELSGYSQDYLGQLIRKGKLPGKKVYVNVAWMTTEEDLVAYIKGSRKGAADGSGKKNRRRTSSSSPARDFARPGVYFLAGFLGAAVFALFYILAVNIDSRLEQRAIEQVTEEPDAIEMPESRRMPDSIEAGLIEL